MPETQAAIDELRNRLAETEPSVGPDRLRSYVNAPQGDLYVVSCWGQATALVGAHLGTVATVEAVPIEVLARACIETGSELFHRQQAPHGVTNYADDTTMPVRVARDAMVSARVLLSRFTGGGFG